MRTPEKADSIQVARCSCGRVMIVLKDDSDDIFASAELDPGQWMQVCEKIIELNGQVVEEVREHHH